jgi:hypothetical protein
MIAVHADTAPYLAARDELALLMKGLDSAALRHISELLNHLPDSFFIKLVNRSTVIADDVDVTVVVQPSERFLGLLEALIARNFDLVLIDRLFVH